MRRHGRWACGRHGVCICGQLGRLVPAGSRPCSRPGSSGRAHRGGTGSGIRGRLDRAALATSVLLIALITCTEDRSPTGPTRTRALVLASDTPVVLVGAGEIARCDSLNDEATAAVLDTIAGAVF